MLRAGEGLAIHSLEGFLSKTEIRNALRAVDALKGTRPAGAFDSGADGKSVHHLASFGLDDGQAAKVFEPQGRIEISVGANLPQVLEVLESAFFRRIEDIRRVYPSATWSIDWTYVEYGAGQGCTSHADGSFSGTQVGAMSVRLDDGTVGGEFYVETCGSDEIWTHEPEDPELILPTHYSNEWLSTIPKTRWLSQPARGTALLWGSHLIHGAQPIVKGTAKKFIAWIEAS
jgi:hypothetical protein